MTEPRRKGPTQGLLETATLSALASALAERRRWLIAGAAAGAVLGAAAALFGAGAGDGAYATVRDVPPWKYESLQIPDLTALERNSKQDGDAASPRVTNLFLLDRNAMMNRIYYGVSSSLTLQQATEAAKSRTAGLFTYLPRAFLQPDRVELIVEPFDSIGKANSEQISGLRLHLKGTHPLVAVDILNEVISRAKSEMQATLLADFRSALKIEKTKVNLQLDGVRTVYEVRSGAELAKLEEGRAKYKLQLSDRMRAVRLELAASRQARILQLGEAIRVAEAVGQVKPAALIAASDASRPLGAQGMDGRSVPLFLFGSEALKEQLQILQNRTSDDQDDSRIAEILRDEDKLKFDREAEAIASRKSVEAYFDSYPVIVARKRVLDNIQPDNLQFEMLDVVQPPNKGKFSTAFYLVDRVLRGIALGFVLAALLVLSSHVLRLLRR